MPLFKGVRDVLQDYKAQDYMLVLCGVHVVAELIGCCPEDGLEAQDSPIAL